MITEQKKIRLIKILAVVIVFLLVLLVRIIWVQKYRESTNTMAMQIAELQAEQQLFENTQIIEGTNDYPRLTRILLQGTYERLQTPQAPAYTNVTVCSYVGESKSIMDGKAITLIGSRQYQLMFESGLITTNGKGHYVYYDKDNVEHYAVALGSIYGNVGDTFRITLDSGSTFYAIKVDEKADAQVDGCGRHADGSLVEFVMDTQELYEANYYQNFTGGLQKYEEFAGTVVSIERAN